MAAATSPALLPEADHDLLRPDRVRDPYPYFAQMRENHPVHWNEQYRAWFVYQYQDLIAALRDPNLSSDRVRHIYAANLSPAQQSERKATFDILGDWMVFLDPPDHTRLRKLVMPAFSPAAIERMLPRVDAVVEDTLATIRHRKEIDLVHDYAYPIPAVVIAELMGVPAADRDLFKVWSDQILVLVFGAAGVPERRAEAQRGLVELADYLRELIATVSKNPGDDLIGRLLNSRELEPPLTREEIISTCALLIFGGHETTTNLIANGIRALLQHPEQLEILRQDPSLVKSAIEELLRYDGPSKMVMRRVAADTTLGGQVLRAGDQVYLVQGSANRDERVFREPDGLDIRRNPNRHVGFGFGLHHCLGNFLARLEASVAINAFVQQLPDLRLQAPASATEDWQPTLISRGMHHLVLGQ